MTAHASLSLGVSLSLVRSLACIIYIRTYAWTPALRGKKYTVRAMRPFRVTVGACEPTSGNLRYSTE